MVLTKSPLLQCLKKNRRGFFDRVLKSAQTWHWEPAKQGRLIFTRHEYLSLSLHSRNSDFALGLWLFLLTFFFNNQKRLIAWKMTLSGYNAQVLALDISNPLVGEGVLKSLSVMYCFSHPFLKHLILAGIKMLKKH